MKDWLSRIKNTKGGPFALSLLLGALALLLLSGGTGEESGMTAEEKRLSATLSCIAGAGETRVSIYYAGEEGFSGSRQPVGAVIVSRGAENIRVRLDLCRAAEALLGLSGENVEVFSMEESP